MPRFLPRVAPVWYDVRRIARRAWPAVRVAPFAHCGSRRPIAQAPRKTRFHSPNKGYLTLSLSIAPDEELRKNSEDNDCAGPSDQCRQTQEKGKSERK